MIKNYFKIAWRNLVKSKGYSVINIGGLAIGMAVAMLIGLWVYDEVTFNKSHDNYDRIAQVMTRGHFAGEGFSGTALSYPLEGALQSQYGSDFKHIVMMRWNESHLLNVDDKTLSFTGRFMGSGGPDMLSLKMLRGNLDALENPSGIILSETAANTLFGSDNPMNKTIRIDNQYDVTVTGVYQDLPANSEFTDAKFMAAFDLLPANFSWIKDAQQNWDNSSFLIYAQLQPNSKLEAVNKKIRLLYQEKQPDVKKYNLEVFLNPMKNWHLYSNWKNGVIAGGRIQYVWMFGLIGIFVLLLACINFMNLATARSEKRAREVGIRKAIGSLRGQLIRQFLSESFLVVVFSFIIALILVQIAIPAFNSLSDKDMSLPWANSYFWLLSLAFMLLTSLLAGSYPALYLSSFAPVKVLKGTFRTGRYASLPRKVLVVTQYTVSVALIIGTIIVYRQIQHAKNRLVGYNRNGLVMIHLKSEDYRRKMDALRNEIKSTGAVASLAQSASPVTAVWSNNGGLTWDNKDPNKEDGFGTIWITPDFGKTVGWDFVAGRDFDAGITADTFMPVEKGTLAKSIIFNEAAIKYMGLKDPVGKIVHWDGYPMQIIGVIRDMVMESPFSPVRQTMYLVNSIDANTGYLNIRINPALGTGEALDKIKIAFKKVLPAVPFEYQFADDEYGKKFAYEERIGQLSLVFAVLAILISCLGLFGLASFVAEKRTREIGIRKVLGASVTALWQMLSTDFLKLVIISSLAAIPLAWYFMHDWLQQYDYRTDIPWWIFGLAVLGAIVITLLTVSFQAVRAALANPVKSLRTE